MGIPQTQPLALYLHTFQAMGKRKSLGTVLVVDDEEPDLKQASDALRSAGFEVLEAGSYSQAMAIFEESPRVQLLLADVVLADGNGCSLAVALHKSRPHVRVLFMSYHVGAEVCKSYGLSVRDIHFLRKPFEAEQLVDRVKQVLKSEEPFPALNVPRTLTSGGY